MDLVRITVYVQSLMKASQERNTISGVCLRGTAHQCIYRGGEGNI